MKPPAENQSGWARIREITRGQTGLASALRKAELYLALNRRIQPMLPVSSRGEIAIACIEGDCLVLAAASPARATQARLHAHSILDQVRTLWPAPLRSTRVVVVPGLRLQQ
ncbi:MAG: hypothetical protein LC637_13830 [Xanthomonadaceae bacterium]|nr:hypothetical protein [Xanthomonadaceae bacterium]